MCIISLFTPVTVFAQNPTDWLPTEGSTVEIPTLVVTVLNWGIGFAALAAVAVLIVAGIMYITASGDEAKIGKATKALTFAIIGLIVCFIAVMLVNFVLATFLGIGSTGGGGGGGGGGTNKPVMF